METSKWDWSFQDYLLWNKNFPICETSLEQSPINVDSSSTINCDLLCQVDFMSKPSTCGIKYENNMVKLNYKPGCYLTYNGNNYMLKSEDDIHRPAISIHTPSLHTIDNQRFDVEIIMVYGSSTEGHPESTDNGVIVSRFANFNLSENEKKKI